MRPEGRRRADLARCLPARASWTGWCCSRPAVTWPASRARAPTRARTRSSTRSRGTAQPRRPHHRCRVDGVARSGHGFGVGVRRRATRRARHGHRGCRRRDARPGSRDARRRPECGRAAGASGAASVPMLADVAPTGPSSRAVASAGTRRSGDEDLADWVAQQVLAAVAAELGLPADGVDPRLPLVEIGVDSIMTVARAPAAGEADRAGAAADAAVGAPDRRRGDRAHRRITCAPRTTFSP